MYSTLEECKEYCIFVGLKPPPERVFHIYERTLIAEKYNYSLTGNIYGMDWNESRYKFNSKQLALGVGVVCKELSC